jgi:hypothetical protein
MKLKFLFLVLLLPITLFAQISKYIYWVENNIQIGDKKDLKVLNHNDSEFNATCKNLKLTIRKKDLNLNKDQIIVYLGNTLKNMGYSPSKEIKYQYKDFLANTYCIAEKEGYWGVFFVLKEELNGDNYFVGYLTTANKPTTENIRIVENFKVIEEGTLSTNDYNNDKEKIEEINSGNDTILIGLLKKYSPEIYNYAEAYYKLPTMVKGNQLLVKNSISETFKDSIPYYSLYYDSWFVYSLFYSLNYYLSIIDNIESSNENKNYLSVLIDPNKQIKIEKFKTPPASIINNTYPTEFKGSNYGDCIFPSTVNRNTQVDGIFGLTSEFEASSFKLKWYIDFLRYYTDNDINTTRFYLEYLYQFPVTSYNTLLYYHYIIKYLAVLKEEMPDTYSRLLSIGDFKFLIKYSVCRFNHFVEEFNETKLKIRNDLGDKYISYIEDETKFLIDSFQYNNNTSLVTFNSLVNFINQEQAYKQVISDFEIPEGKGIVIIKE